MTSKVSVVVPTFNYGHFLAGALQSALDQTFLDLEVLVVDDGSTDDTPAVITPFLADVRIRYFRQANQGPAAARNFGIEQARGSLVAFLDADDRWLPSKLAKQVPLFAAQPELGLVYCRRRCIDADGWPLEHRQPVMHRGLVLAQLFRDNFVCFSSAVFRREALLAVGGFDQAVEHSEDYDLLLRVTRRYPVDYVDEPLVVYRTGHGNLSSQSEKRFRAVCGIMQRFLDDGGRDLLPAGLVRQAWAETYCHWADARRHATRKNAASMYLRALTWRLGLWEAWKGLASLGVPEGTRRWLRKLLGRPAQWGPRRLSGPRLAQCEPALERLVELSCATPIAPSPPP
jgi:glycosyltransferase involved in cell wall biosynthesis